jgi:hypothetical protein
LKGAEMKRIIIVLTLGLFLGWMSPVNAATVVLEDTGFIFGYGGETYSFVADQTPLLYNVTLTDLEFPGAFDILGVAITTATDSVVELLAPGSKTFSVDFETTYFANVLGLAADDLGAGLFGIKITAVPIPPTLILLGTGLIGFIGLKKKYKK